VLQFSCIIENETLALVDEDQNAGGDVIGIAEYGNDQHVIHLCACAFIRYTAPVGVPVKALSNYGLSNATLSAIICAVLRCLERNESKTQHTSTHQHGDEASMTSVVVSD
jgi:hypothetical protein